LRGASCCEDAAVARSFEGGNRMRRGCLLQYQARHSAVRDRPPCTLPPDDGVSGPAPLPGIEWDRPGQTPDGGSRPSVSFEERETGRSRVSVAARDLSWP